MWIRKGENTYNFAIFGKVAPKYCIMSIRCCIAAVKLQDNILSILLNTDVFAVPSYYLETGFYFIIHGNFIGFSPLDLNAPSKWQNVGVCKMQIKNCNNVQYIF